MVTFTVKNLDEVRRLVRRYPNKVKPHLGKAMRQVGRVVKDGSVELTPISPTKQQYKKSLKRGKSKRTDFHPGNLRKSIRILQNTTFSVDIGVPRNSLGGRYANFIHNGTYNLGPGSMAAKGKGQDVGPKFLERAVTKNENAIHHVVVREINKLNRRL